MNNDVKFEAFGKVTIKNKKNKTKLAGNDKCVDIEEEAKELIQVPNKGGSTQAHAIADPATGHVVVSAEEIKRVSLEYCKKVLTNNVPDKEFEKEIELKENMHKERMLA